MPTLRTDDLDIAYGNTGNVKRGMVLLLHGWPDNVSTWDMVAPALTEAGFRTVVPMLRDFGDTRFVDNAAPRTGNSGILTMDAIKMIGLPDVGHFPQR